MPASPSFPSAAALSPQGLAELSPANFALVMATGIVSLAAHLHGLDGIALALFGFNALAWLTLWVLYLLRMLRHPRHFFGDLIDHQRGPGFFTAVAGSAVLGSQFLVLSDNLAAAVALFGLALLLWLGLTYTLFTAFTIKVDKPPLEKGISGAWLLAVVATQSLAVLGSLLAARTQAPWEPRLDFLALTLWLGGGMLYIWLSTLIVYRCLFYRISPDELTPPYWINMGAMAISTLAGALLILHAPDAPSLEPLLPFLKGITLLYWATGTWWVPMLLLLGIWRYIHKRYPLRYGPLYWGMVFPLGMYAASTHQMVLALSIDFLDFLSPAVLYVALAAWAATLFGLTRHLLSKR